MSIAPAEPDVDELQHLDFDPVLPCEAAEHAIMHVPDDPAAWVIGWRCPACGRGRPVLYCESGYGLLLAMLRRGSVRLVCVLGCRASTPLSLWVCSATRIDGGTR